MGGNNSALNSTSTDSGLHLNTKSERFVYNLKFLLVGDAGVGKTCLFVRYISDEEGDGTATVGANFKVKRIELNGLTVKLAVWDTAGQERFRSTTYHFYRGAEAIVLVYDITNKITFESCRNWIHTIQQQAPDAIILLVGNKVDLSSKRQVTAAEGKQFADEHKLPWLETSAKNKQSVDEIFYKLAEMTQQKLVTAEKRIEAIKQATELVVNCHLRTAERQWIAYTQCSIKINQTGITTSISSTGWFGWMFGKKTEFTYFKEYLEVAQDATNKCMLQIRDFIKDRTELLLFEQDKHLNLFIDACKAFYPNTLKNKVDVFSSESDFMATYERHCSNMKLQPIDVKQHIQNNALDVRQIFTVNHCRAFSEALRWSGFITKLDVSYIPLKFSGIQVLCSALRMSMTLRELYCKQCSLGEKGAGQIGGLLVGNTSLQILHIGGNNIGSGGIYIASAFMDNNTLTSLEMDRNNIGDQTVIKLSEALQNNSQCALTSLSLWQNKVTNEGWKVLVTALENLPNFKELNYDDNFMDSELSNKLKMKLEYNSESNNSQQNAGSTTPPITTNFEEISVNTSELGADSEILVKSLMEENINLKKTIALERKKVEEVQLEKQKFEEEKKQLEDKKKSIIDFEKDELVELRILGHGTYATVHACKFVGKYGVFAVKTFILPADSLKRDVLISSYQQELMTLRELNHENIVRLVGWRMTANKLLLFMDLYDCTLSRVIFDKKEKCRDPLALFSVSDIKNYCLQILHGLRYLHRKQVAHRDLKSENVLVLLSNLKTVKSLHISDFGTARAVLESTSASTVIGTPGCMDPLISSQGYDPFKADVWSFGVLLFELLGGSRPSQFGNFVLPPYTPSDRKSLFDIFHKCTVLEADKRPSASDLVNEFEDISC